MLPDFENNQQQGRLRGLRSKSDDDEEMMFGGQKKKREPLFKSWNPLHIIFGVFFGALTLSIFLRVLFPSLYHQVYDDDYELYEEESSEDPIVQQAAKSNKPPVKTKTTSSVPVKTPKSSPAGTGTTVPASAAAKKTLLNMKRTKVVREDDLYSNSEDEYNNIAHHDEDGNYPARVDGAADRKIKAAAAAPAGTASKVSTSTQDDGKDAAAPGQQDVAEGSFLNVAGPPQGPKNHQQRIVSSKKLTTATGEEVELVEMEETKMGDDDGITTAGAAPGDVQTADVTEIQNRVTSIGEILTKATTNILKKHKKKSRSTIVMT
ncbi:unnamed protein product [Amoebophrya sp. A120]|nr:unnamed protein product [Amoebophrya sp. A120]|eukprot:GSA120T00004340001.1